MDNKDINSKTSPNQMRVFMKRMRTGNFVVSENKDNTKHELSMRDMLKITRKLNEDVEQELLDKINSDKDMPKTLSHVDEETQLLFMLKWA